MSSYVQSNPMSISVQSTNDTDTLGGRFSREAKNGVGMEPIGQLRSKAYEQSKVENIALLLPEW